jgi:N-acetyl-alpha-D-muramate 1-phosphate uridylyltransferase
MIIKQAMVLAAGLGTRMRPITETMPKPLVRIGDKPMIDYVLDALVDAGVETVAVNVHHHADQMEAHLAKSESPTNGLS